MSFRQEPAHPRAREREPAHKRRISSGQDHSLSDRIGAAYTDCLAFLPRGDGDITVDVPKPITSPNDRIASGLELDVALRECSELSDAGNRHGGRIVRYEGQPDRLIQ